jgi:TonB family protein
MSLGWIGAAPACKSDDAPKVAASSTTPATAAAGRVLEVSGTVTVAGKPLARGDTVVASAVIETGADGSVAIELLHNLARWELGPNKHVRVDESLAWREPKRTEAVAEVVHDTTSAGRPVERQAASTSVTASAVGDEDKGAPDTDKHPVEGTKQGGGGGAKGSDSIGLGGIGTIGHGAGTGHGQGYGAGGGKLGGSHQTKAVKIAQGDAQVSGALPTEVIRRIVRQNFGRLKMCYESGLRSNPALAGKVVVRFLIDRAGAVTNAQAQSSTIGDETVVACVVRAFTTLSFPEPENGSVTVTYPVLFSPE